MDWRLFTGHCKLGITLNGKISSKGKFSNGVIWGSDTLQYRNDEEMKAGLNLKEIPVHYQTETIYRYGQDKQNFISNLA